MDQLNKTYEMLYFLTITLSDEEIKTLKDKIHKLFEKQQATIIKEEDLGKRKLAYMIKRARHGYYFLIKFTAPPTAIRELNHQLELMPEIIRHRITIKQKNTMAPIKIKTTQTDSNNITSANTKNFPTPAENDKKTKLASQEQEKVDSQELNRKIDELLSENI